MSVRAEYMQYKNANSLQPGNFHDRTKLQLFIRDRLDQVWSEGVNFSNGGLQQNYMTGYALGFAYYDCRPTEFCRLRCYGLALGGVFDFNMLRLAVITSESLRNGDGRYIDTIKTQISRLNLQCVKIGHWGDAVLEQVPHIADIARSFPSTTFWWYTRKPEIAIAVNKLHLGNLRSYLSLDPDTSYPSTDEYPYGLTYLYGKDQFHEAHDQIIRDPRLVAIFSLKKGQSVEDPNNAGLSDHPHICIEKKWKAETHKKRDLLCLNCRGRCNFA